MEKKILIGLITGFSVWFILFTAGMIYADHLERKYDPIGYERSQRSNVSSGENYGFCDMWMVQVMPQFISPHGCN